MFFCEGTSANAQLQTQQTKRTWERKNTLCPQYCEYHMIYEMFVDVLTEGWRLFATSKLY